eukprot:m.27817 g.27817  ORF g.27817 m.27817 type:complete len:648 (+) comp8977_c0_seq2:32-1975(+)
MAKNLALSGAVAIVALVAAACYSNSLEGNFVFDDMPAIVNNADVDAAKTSLLTLFKNNFWGEPMDAFNAQHQSYRPLTTLTFRWNNSIHGMDKYWFHLTNLILHAIASGLVVVLANQLFGSTSLWDATLAGLLFATHPVHVEAVSGLVGRAELLSAIFFILSFLTYQKAIPESPSQPSQMRFVGIAVLLAAIATLCKEQGVTVVIACAVGDLFSTTNATIFDVVSFLQGLVNGSRSRRAGARKQKNTKNQNQSGSWDSVVKGTQLPTFATQPAVRSSFQRILMLAGLSFVVVVARVMVNTQQIIVDEKTNPSHHIKNFTFRTLTKSLYAALHSWLLVFPRTLCCDWSGGAIPNIKSLFDVRILAIFACFVAVVWLLFLAVAHRNNLTRRELALPLAITIGSFLPASGLFMDVGFVLAERILYLPSIGYCMLVVALMRAITRQVRHQTPSTDTKSKLTDSKTNTKSDSTANQMASPATTGSTPLFSVQTALLVIVVALYFSRSYERNEDWQSEIKLYESGLLAAPTNAKLHHNYAYYASGEDQEFHYREAIKLYPPYISAYINLGVNLSQRGMDKEAIEIYKKGLEMHYKYPLYSTDVGVLHRNLGFASMRVGRTEDALHWFKSCLTVRTNHTRCKQMIAQLEQQLKP